MASYFVACATQADGRQAVHEARPSAQAGLQEIAQPVLVVQVFAGDGHRRAVGKHVQLLARYVTLFEQREHVARRRVSLQDEDVTLAGDADDSAGHPRRVPPDDGAVG